KARGHHLLARVDAFGEDSLRLVLQRQRDRAQADTVSLRNIDESAGGPALHGLGGNHHHLLQGLNENAHVYELAGPELQVGVWNLTLHAYGAGGLVDLVVHDLQGAAIEHRPAVAVDGLYRHRAGGLSGIDLSQLLLRQREKDLDRPHLVDHDDARIRGM